MTCPLLLAYVSWCIEYLFPCMNMKHYCRLLHQEESHLRLNHGDAVKFLVENGCWHAVKDNGIWFHKAYFILKVSQATLTDEWVKCWRSSDCVGKCAAVMYCVIAYMQLWTMETGFLFYYWGSPRLAPVLSEKHSGISNFHLDEHRRQTERATV